MLIELSTFFIIILAVLVVLWMSDLLYILAPPLNWIARKLGLQEESTQSENIGQGADGLIGVDAIVKQDFILNDTTAIYEGRVLAKGTLWKAELTEGNFAPKIGERVIIEKFEGNKLFVKKTYNNAI